MRRAPGSRRRSGCTQFPATAGRRSHDERTVGHCFCHGFVFFSILQHFGGADCGSCFAKGDLIGVHDAKLADTEIAHGASSGPEVEGISRGDENDAKMVEVRRSGQRRGF